MTADPLPKMECKGINGTVVFDGAFVSIRRKGAMARMTVGKVRSVFPLVS